MDRRKRKKIRTEGLVGRIFILCLLAVMIINFIVPDRESSDEENRMLTSAPELSGGSVLNGDYMDQFESYMSDQFAGRDMFRRVKVLLDRIGGSRMENGVYIGSDGQLMEDIELPDQEHLSANLEAISSFASSYSDIPVSMILVPDAACVLSDRLPALASVEDQTQMISMVQRQLGDSVNWIDAVSVLNKHKGEKIYYKTDHHWTALGAFYVFQTAAPDLGIGEDVSDKYVSYTVSDSFNGALASVSGVGLGERETIDIYAPTAVDDDVIVNYVDEAKRTTSLYDSSKLETKDQYGVYLGGNTSLLDIQTVSTSRDRILVVKDSFANCFIPLLAPYYREIVVVDPRYYSGTIEDIMDSYRIADVLFLYSGNTFFTDNSISGVFDSE